MPVRKRVDRTPRTSPCCEAAVTYDKDGVGRTCGGLWVRGVDVCKVCGGFSLPPRGLSKPCDAPVWTVTSSGRSVDIGNGRIRFGTIKVDTGESLDLQGLMTRVARLPELERMVAYLVEVVERELPPVRDDGDEAEQAGRVMLADAMARARVLAGITR